MKRRTWILASAAALGGVVTGGLSVGLLLRHDHFESEARRRTQEPGEILLGGWVKLSPEGAVTVYVPHSEMGQGAATALAMMVADEMDADWARVRAEQAPADPAFANGFFVQAFLLNGKEVPEFAQSAVSLGFGEVARLGNLQITGGSGSVRLTGQHGFRSVGAAVRAMLVQAAAEEWAVPAKELRARDGVVSHEASGRQSEYGRLAAAAAKLPVPENPRLKTKAEFRLVGKSIPRFDIPDKVVGRTRYGIDAQLPGMLVATVKASPIHGGTLSSVDAAPALAIPGVRKVVKMKNSVAVVADGYWPAHQGLQALQPSFMSGFGAATDSMGIRQSMESKLSAGGRTVHSRGDVGAVKDGPEISATYHVPFLHHATMEPINVTARWADGRLEVWGSEQDALGARANLQKISGLPLSQVTFTPMSLGGGFGRRSAPKKDHLEQAVEIAKAVSPRPVKLIWSREEDFAQGTYRPAVATRIAARLDKDGLPASWTQAFTDTPGLINEGYPLVYDIPNQHLVAVDFLSHVRVGAWRSVAHSQHGFFTETFVDELASHAGKDPFEYRRAMLETRPRHRAVLEAAAMHGSWGKPLPTGWGRGIALVESFGSIVAEVIEASLDTDGMPRVHRVVAAVDCGLLVNPNTGRQQVEGAVIMGLSAALAEAITIKDGAVVQRGFPDYPVLKMRDIPQIEVHFVESEARPGGLGEVGLPPAAPALANALRAATGKAVTSLPLRDHYSAPARQG